MTLQLLEAQLPLILVINMMDEAEELGIKVDRSRLEQLLGIPVILAAAARTQGIGELRRQIYAYRKL
jgi:ferrous iron transport protein B